MASIPHRIRQLAEELPDTVAFTQLALDGSEPAYTFAELDRRSSQLAGALRDRGLCHGDRLGIGLRNSVQFVVSSFAAWKLGAVPVPVRWDVPDWELGRLREVVEPKLFLGLDDLEWIDATAALDVPELEDATAPHMNGICSSGSTGTPKVILTMRKGEYDPALAPPFIAQWAPVERPQCVLVLGPMYHANGLSGLFSLLNADRVVAMEKFDAARVVDAVERLHVSTFTATPTMLQRIADLPGIEQRDLSSLRWILQGSAPMPPSLMHRWIALIGAEKIVMTYGMTEGLGTTGMRGDEWLEHQGSVGRGLRNTEIRILGPDGEDLPRGEIGDIYLRSPFFGGVSYLGTAPQLAGTEDGFKSVGDMGYLDEGDYLYVVDRRVDLIVSGGANVYPAEVEFALIDHPQVADVVVIGLRDAEWGRRVHAVIEPRDHAAPPTAEEIIAFAKGRLAPYKVPKTVEFVEAVPRSAATKVNRRALIDARGG